MAFQTKQIFFMHFGKEFIHEGCERVSMHAQ